MSIPRHDILTLCDALCEGRLDPEQADLFMQSLADDADALRDYIRACHLHAAMYRVIGGLATPAPATPADRRPAPPVLAIGRLAAVAAVLIAVAFVAHRAITHRISERADLATDEADRVVGVASYETPRPVRITPGKPFTLDPGASQFVLTSGATFLADGPATLTIVSGRRVDLHEGSLTFVIPPGSGDFAVSAGDLHITHIGTEFVVSRGGGTVEVHVLDGSVRVARGDEAVVLAAGEAMRATGGGVSRMRADLGLFGIDAPIARNELANAGFEEAGDAGAGVLVGWTTFGWDSRFENVARGAGSSVTPHAGRAAAVVSGRFDTEVNYAGLYQDMPVEPGERCRGSVWIAHAGADPLRGGNAAFCKIEFYDADGHTLEHHESDRLAATDRPDDYRRRAIEAIAPDAAATVRFVLIFEQDAAGSTGCALFDDAAFSREKAEP